MATETKEQPTVEEAERHEHEQPTAPEPEVRADELTEGAGDIVGTSAWPEAVIEELGQPLDPNRVRRRQQYEYLAGHDVKRRATQIFGFGNWGHRVKALDELAAVQVTNDDGREGWHVGFRCIVQVWVRTDDPERPFVTEGVGYGDGVQYTPAARVQSCELAIKEAETDALKRAFTNLGDQFGLILYAKGDEKKRIARDRDADSSREAVRQDAETNVPKTWPDIGKMFAGVLGGDQLDEPVAQSKEWIRQAAQERYGKTFGALTPAERTQFGRKMAGVAVALADRHGDLGMGEGVRDKVAKVIAEFCDGVTVAGPPWRLGPDEADQQTYEEWKATQAAQEPSTGDAEPEAEPEAAPAETKA